MNWDIPNSSRIEVCAGETVTPVYKCLYINIQTNDETLYLKREWSNRILEIKQTWNLS